MKYTPGPVVGVLSRSQGNTTAARNRYGTYLRNRGIPTNPGTPLQLARRSVLTKLSQDWRTLTEQQREDWNALGSQIVRTDTLGNQYHLTGSVTFISINFYRILAGLAVVTDAPFLDGPSNVFSVSVSALVIGPDLDVAFTPTPFPAGNRLLVYASPAVSQGKSFLGHPGQYTGSPGLYRLMTLTAPAPASPLDILAAWQAQFGTFTSGQRISAQVIPLSPNFIPGQAVRGDVIVP